MPLIPATWLSEFTVNPTTAGTQSQPRVTQLISGNILVSWHSDNNTGSGSGPGIDVIGQVFNPLGVAIGGEFQLNGFLLNDERAADVAALPTGGFLTVYEDFDGSTRSIRMTGYDASEQNPVSLSIVTDTTVNADETYFVPRVAVSSATSALIVYQVAEAGNNDTRIVGRIFDSVGATVGPEINLIDDPGTNSAPQVVVLTNGNYVITAATVDQVGEWVITLRIVNAAGDNVLGLARLADADGEFDSEPAIAALTGGGFVIAWTNTDSNDTGIVAQVFSDAGVAQGNLINVTLGDAADNANEASVVALADGGFIVFFDDDQAGELRGRRYDATGTALTGEFTIAAGGIGITNIDSELLDDGRVVVTYRRADFEIGMEIIDTRDAANTPDFDPWQIGTIGDDVFTAGGLAEFVAGHDGNDVITEAGGVRSYLMGAGDDVLRVRSQINGDVHDGGSGVDTIDWTDSPVYQATFYLATGIATRPGFAEMMTGFENLIGSGQPDRIIGSDAENRLVGGDGADTISGGDGFDTLEGGDGDDELSGGAFDDVVNGEGGNDIIVVGSGDGVDDADGGPGIDTLDYSGTTATIEFDMITGLFDFSGILRNAVNFETYIDNAGNGTVLGTAADNRLVGNGGHDLLNGGAGFDTLDGGSGDDTLRGGSGIDTFYGGDGDDDISGDTETTEAEGGDGNDTIRGGGGNDYLWGGNDDDLIFGGSGGLDVLEGGAGDDNITGSSGRSVLRGGTGHDSLTGRDVADVLDGGTGRDTLIGGDGDDNLDGGEEADRLNGGGGDDTLSGGIGADSLFGDAGNDLLFANITDEGISSGESLFANSLFGGTDQDTLFGASSLDLLFGGADADTLLGDSGADRLDGGTGNDALDGGLGNDTYFVDSAGDTVVNEIGFSVGGGIDTVFTSVNFTAPTNVELVRAQAGAGNLTLTGNDAPGTLVGNEGANRLEGRGGNDQVNGNVGNDTLIGGEGRDTLVGGAGADTFVFTSISNSRAGSANRDVINGFDRGATQDRIDLSAIDANTLTPGVNDAFSFIGTAAFATTGSAGQLRLVSLGGANAVIVEADINGDRVADFQIFVNLQTTMVMGDFLL